MTGASRRPTLRPRLTPVWLHVLLCVVPVAVLLGSFAVLTPVTSAPDEPAHYIHAVASVRGVLSGTNVRVPASTLGVDSATCMAQHNEITGACQRPYSASGSAVAWTYTGNYNPVYYLWVGLPTLRWAGPSGIYAARLMSALVTALMLGWGLSLLLRRVGGWAVAAYAVAWTPMASYLGSVINPSGWEIAGALASTVAAWLVLRAPDRWGEAHYLLVLSGVLFVLSRSGSPEYAVVIGLAVAALTGWRASWAAVRRRPTMVAVAVLAVAAVASLLWTETHPTQLLGAQPLTSVHQARMVFVQYYHGIWFQLQQYVGDTGWLDTPPPTGLVPLWSGAAISVVGLSYVLGTRRTRLVLLLGCAVAYVLPAVLGVLVFGGPGWQGRYALPLVCALLVIAGLCTAESSETKELPASLVSLRHQAVIGAAVLFVVLHVGVIAVTVHRMSQGAPVSWSSPVLWTGPLGLRLPLATAAAALVVLAATIMSARRSSGVSPAPIEA